MTFTRKRISRLCVMFLCIAGAATVAGAHHSQSQFEPEKTLVIEGTLTRLSWRNPHTLFLIQAKEAGGAGAEQEWTVEGPSPAQLTRAGWGSAVSKVGDKVTFNGRPRRDGRPELLLLSVTLADGKKLTFIPD
jgi:hypothetical protein